MTVGRRRPRVASGHRLRGSDLVGGWRLASWEIVYGGDGRVTRPFGRSPSGLILYTPDGCMSATIAAEGRPLLSSENPRRAGVDERATAFDSFFSYAGTYRVRGDTVVHELRAALNPAMVGTRQVRRVRLAGDTLELSATEPAGGAGTRTHRIVWKRLKKRARS